jgi:hypothetical protein
LRPGVCALNQALKDKLVSEGEIDTAVKRLFTARFRLGMFDPPQDVPYARIPLSEVDSEAHRMLARQVARESIVLLKNANGILPLQAKGKTIAVIGPNATILESLEGNYNGQPTHPVLPLDGIEKLALALTPRSCMPRAHRMSQAFPSPCRARSAQRRRDGIEGRVLQQRCVARPTGADPGRQAGGFRLGRRLTRRRHTRVGLQCPLERIHRRAGRGRLRLSNIAGTLFPRATGPIPTGSTWTASRY